MFEKTIGEHFGIIHGNSTLVFIKTGRGGTINGFEDKYLKIATKLSNSFGYTIVVSANPQNSDFNIEDELGIIEKNTSSYKEIYYVGISNGALVGAQQGFEIDRIKKMFLINAPLMINWPKTKIGIENFKGEMIKFVYGEKDPSYKFLKLIELIQNKACEYEIVKGEGHNISLELLDLLIFNFIVQCCNLHR